MAMAKVDIEMGEAEALKEPTILEAEPEEAEGMEACCSTFIKFISILLIVLTFPFSLCATVHIVKVNP